MMRVAHLTFSGAFGGREKVAFSLVRALNSSIAAKLYLVLESRTDQDKQKDLMQHLSSYAMPTRILQTDAFFSNSTCKELAAYIQEDDINIIHAHCHKSLSYALILKYLHCPGLLVTCTLHGLKIPFDCKYLVHHLLSMVGMIGSDGIIGCSREIVSTINKVPFLNRKVSIIRNNLPFIKKQLANRNDLRAAFSHRNNIPKHKTCWIGNASRLTAQKNIPLFLDSISRYASESNSNNAIFLLAGDGELKDELLARAARLGLNDSFRFVGFLTGMDEFYSMLDLFVLTSDWEGTPMAALEAMSHGLPVIASSVGGVPDVVVNNTTGILFPKGDVQACVAALHMLIGAEDARIKMGIAARERILTEFTEERWVSEHLSHYQLLLSREG
ncbi:glycosyltransferase family 4 protein [Pelotalea chapellei]|uniref:Glycosyltransferase family 4 protein n=1 Tax=Pelotalea chapellei TaxID=44671 RepID=A0ABS5U5F8_9BACT|nr:glycosyltransferase family 4 protein [Pelotalea chapellei]MBT1070892.1 glycosyltransferase family 4 protein [Pelotalea chapellei]